jgi:plastocyanin
LRSTVSALTSPADASEAASFSGSAAAGVRGTERPVRRARAVGTALAVALLALALAAGHVAASTTTVTMDNGDDFSPSYVSIARGDTVLWKNNGYVGHDVYGTRPSAYFKSGPPGAMGNGDTYSKTFKSAGSFPYVCRVHSGMEGRVVVSMGATRSVVDGVVKFKLTVASEALSSSSAFRHVVWVDPPGGDWQIYKTTTKAKVTYTPSDAGTYYFRSAVKRLSNGSTSDWSPVKSLTK